MEKSLCVPICLGRDTAALVLCLCLDRATQPRDILQRERHLEVPRADLTEPWFAYLGQQSLLPTGSQHF